MTDVRKVSRRDFLVVGAAAAGGLILATRLPARGRRWSDGDLTPNAFLQVAPDGAVTIWMARADMGQGVRTALPMVVADELDADWKQVTIVQADAHPSKYGRQMTVGSSSVRGGPFTNLRRAGAAAREMLVAAAAARWSVPATECATDAGVVTHQASGRKAGYGELAEAAARLPVPKSPRLKDPKEFRLIGTRVPQVDIKAKVTGQAGFGLDVTRPGMLYATVVRPPVFGGALRSFDAAAAKAVPGVKDAVAIASGVAVVAEHTWAAFQGAKALRIDWDDGDFRSGTADLGAEFGRRMELSGATAKDDGDAAAALAAAAKRIEATYDAPFLSHATMEPMNCTADVRADRCEIWAPTQNPQGAQRVAMELTGLPADQVAVHITYLGCGWGRRGATEYVDDAVELSRKLGAPVKVTWTREEDMRHDHYRPSARCRFEAAVDAAGKVTAVHARVAATPIGGRASGVDRNGVDGIANALYRFPNFLVDNHPVITEVPTGYWRSVGASQNSFFMESFVDELAHAAGRDPVELRRELLGDQPRPRRVLDLAAAKAGWGSPPPAGRARGIALVENRGSFVAQVAEVSRENGRIRVHRVVCAADCGQIIHPGIVEAQIGGAAVAGIAAALGEEITVANGRVQQSNFGDYRLLRMNQAPRVEVYLVESHEDPGAVGEPGLPGIAPAVANAVFALDGTRLRRMPLMPG